MLFRENEQRRVEGPGSASASHQIANVSSVCTARTSWLVHTPKRDRKRFTRSDLLGTSATELCLALPHVCRSDVQRARRRYLCSRCTPLVSQPRMTACSHASEHVMLMLTCARVCACADVQRGQWLASVATNEGLQDASMAHGHGLCMSWSREARAAAVR